MSDNVTVKIISRLLDDLRFLTVGGPSLGHLDLLGRGVSDDVFSLSGLFGVDLSPRLVLGSGSAPGEGPLVGTIVAEAEDGDD